MLSNIEHLGMERMPYALLSYVLLIEFVYDHNPLLLRRMSPPDFFSSSNKLVLSTSTIEQLNIAGSAKSSPSSKGWQTYSAKRRQQMFDQRGKAAAHEENICPGSRCF